ncbi:DNA repair protein RecN [Kocuria sp.]|uniref:DNA repair protein RecN n=1 Tax=Kocuria sp. TaxID=1871328 RepID=UPI0026DF5BCB|nr:DNA repair protein RecN [Kocuria sp.]MDO5619493.1 DNA repair protein RecN [Kocuria sp.]
MIEEIHIRDLGVITDAVLPLGPGLSILSGETGAGKTMVVTALGMLLGDRSDAGAVRSGAEKALAEAVVNVPATHRAVQLVEDAGGDVDREASADSTADTATLQLSRTVAASGRSRAHVGGRSAPVARLSEVGETLVAVHGQSDQLRLTSAAAQRHALDTYATVHAAGDSPQLAGDFPHLLSTYRQTLSEFEEVSGQLREIREKVRERALEAQSLQMALEEIDTVDPQPGEDVELDAESHKLTHVEALRTAATTAHATLSGGEMDAEAPAAVVLIAGAQQALDQEAEADPELAELARRVRELAVLVNDVAADLSGYASGLDEDAPARLAQVESRRAALRSLTRTYGADIQGVLEFAHTARQRLGTLVEDPHREEELAERRAELGLELQAQALALTDRRQAAARELCQAVSTELAALAMPNAALVVTVTPTESFDRHGRDRVEFLLRSHAEATPRPLGKGASGGELSRLMLALEVVLAAVDPVPTFVFDEVDSGVGGKAAVEIGRRLKMLAQHVQVLVVTHLPQVAAFADQHILVSKSSDSTVSDVRVLEPDERVVELARMLAGHQNSQAARDHAQELLEAAVLPASQP